MTTHQRRQPPRGRQKRRLPKLIGGLALTGVYWFPIRRWMGRWGTTPGELARPMAGDALLANPTDVSTGAITVNAPPEDIWPWLVQMGYQRGGLYSYDWLDRLFGFLDRPSANRIFPEFQQLAVGDKIPWDGRGAEMTVELVEPLRALALSMKIGKSFVWLWQFGLYPIDDQRTRFVQRGSEFVPRNPLWWLFERISELAAFPMTRRFMLGVKHRAEALRASHPSETVPARSAQPAGVAAAK
jgi:hypothetical protein